MLNLAQVNHSVKFAKMTLVPNEASLLGLNECYKRLKALGWTSSNEVHPTGRTSLFRLGGATIHHDRTNPGTWVVEVAGGILCRQGDLVAITAKAIQLDKEAQAATRQPLSIAAQHAAILQAEYPHLAQRITRALALVEAGQLDFTQYGTSFDPATFYGCYSCDCPDSINRKPKAKFGSACKHSLAMEISRRVQAENKSVAYRKLSDRLEADRARRLATQAGYDFALRPDSVNQKVTHRFQFQGIGHR